MSDLAKRELIDLDNLTPEQALRVQARIIGFKRMPVDIETFIEDEYYLGKIWGKGKLYKYWKDILKKIYPNPINVAYNYIILTGPIGGGKSTVSGIAALYTIYKLSCLENYDYFGIQILKGIAAVFFHQTSGKAWDLLVEPINRQIERCPYFAAHPEIWQEFSMECEGVRNDKATGNDVLFYQFSEVNFVDYDRVKLKVDQSFDRLKSRYIKILDYFGNIIIDSSAASEGSLVEDLIREYPVSMLVVRDPIWVIKESLGIYFKTPDEKGKLSFTVYTGDGTREPFIVEDDSQTQDCDPDKFIEVPNELKDQYRSNITLSLQNSAGIGTCATNSFIQDKAALRAAFNIKNTIPELIIADFYNDDQYIDLIRPQLMQIPEEKILCCGIDMGVSGDLAGFALSYIDDYVYKEGKKTIEFKTVTPFAISIGRKPGEETSITKIYNLIMDIHAIREIGLVVTDQYQSTQLRQDLERAGIWSYLSSVDRTKEPYLFYKLQIYKGLQSTVKNNSLYEEQRDLVDTGYMIDHSEAGVDRKDCSDAVVNSVYALNINQDFFMNVSIRHAEKMQKKIIDYYTSDLDIIREELNNRRF